MGCAKVPVIGELYQFSCLTQCPPLHQHGNACNTTFGGISLRNKPDPFLSCHSTSKSNEHPILQLIRYPIAFMILIHAHMGLKVLGPTIPETRLVMVCILHGHLKWEIAKLHTREFHFTFGSFQVAR